MNFANKTAVILPDFFVKSIILSFQEKRYWSLCESNWPVTAKKCRPFSRGANIRTGGYGCRLFRYEALARLLEFVVTLE